MPVPITRAQLLHAGARGGAAVILGGAALDALAPVADATPPSGAPGPLPTGDLAYARLLLVWELLAVDFYQHALAAGHLDRATSDVFRLALANERAHYAYLAGAVTAAGGVPLTAADVDFSYPAGGFTSARSLGRLALTFERLTLASYLGAGAAITTTALSGAVAQIAANEAQHLSVISIQHGVAPFQDAFPATMTIADSSNALDRYTA